MSFAKASGRRPWHVIVVTHLLALGSVRTTMRWLGQPGGLAQTTAGLSTRLALKLFH